MFFSSFLACLFKENIQIKKGKNIFMENRQPKFDPKNSFSWAKGKGTMSERGHGILFGLHLAGFGATDLARLLSISRRGVYDSIKATTVVLEPSVPTPDLIFGDPNGGGNERC